jgi:hypothetical protein
MVGEDVQRTDEAVSLLPRRWWGVLRLTSQSRQGEDVP